MAQTTKTSANNIEQAQTFTKKLLAVTKARANKAPMKETVKMPRTINEYTYNNGDWTLEAQHSYRYDSKSGSLVMEETVANDKSYKTRNVYEYDSKETDFCTSQTQYNFTPSTSTTSTSLVVSKKVVKRDSQGRITEVTSYEYDESKNDLAMTYHNTFEYGDNGKPTKMVRVSSSVDEDNKTSIMTMTFTNIVWDTYDGNLLTAFGTSDEDMVLDPANRIMTADLKLEFDGESQSFNGTVTGEYTDKKSSLDIALTYGSVVVMDEKYTDEILDNNGSHCLSMDVQVMQDVSSQEFTTWLMTMTMLYNEKGEELEQTVRQGDDANSLEIQQSVKYDNSYDAETGQRTTSILSEYDTDTKTYKPVTKLEVVKYVDVTAIDGVTDNAESGKAQIFNAQGMFMGNNLNALSSGLYIVKQNGKSIKVNK